MSLDAFVITLLIAVGSVGVGTLVGAIILI